MTQAGSASLELMLLVDGELDGGEAALIGRRCRDDPATAAAVSALETERALLRAAFPPAVDISVNVLAALDAAFAAQGRRRRRTFVTAAVKQALDPRSEIGIEREELEQDAITVEIAAP